jgi:hypothetical protein
MRTFILALVAACSPQEPPGTAIDTGGLSDVPTSASCDDFSGTEHDALGAGSPPDPYLLCNADQLDSLRLSGSTISKGKHYRLGADIDLGGMDFGRGIGYCDEIFSDASGGFRGTFDGDGHTLSNLTLFHPGPQAGFFGCINGGELRNIVFDRPSNTWPGGSELQDGYWRGVAAGYGVNATFEDVHVLNGVVQGSQRVGGIVGTARSSTAIRVSFGGGDPGSGPGGEVTGSGSVGGLVGLIEWTSVWDSYAWGTVTADLLAGGLFGHANALLDDMAICRSYAAVDIAIVGVEDDPRPGRVVGKISGEPTFGSVSGEGPCAGSDEAWTVFGMDSDTSDASAISGSGEPVGNAQSHTFEELCQVDPYEAAGWDLEEGAWNPPSDGSPPTLR